MTGRDTYRSKLIHLANKLQHQKKIPLWMIANQNVIVAAATNETSIWGPKSNRLRKMINIAYRCKVAGFVIFLTGLLQAFSIYRQARKHEVDQAKTDIEYIFAGFGASMEERLYGNFLKQIGNRPSLRINWVTGEGVATLGYPRWCSVMAILLRYSFRCTALLQNAEKEISANIVDFLTVSALNIGPYAFYYSYWTKVKTAGMKEVTFLVPCISAFACVDAGIKTVFKQHGSLELGILIPQVSRVNMLTEEEAGYFRELLKTVPIYVEQKLPQTRTAVKRKSLIVLSPSHFRGIHLSRLKSLIEWAKQQKFDIIMRVARTLTPDQAIALLEEFPGVELDQSGTIFPHYLESLNPQFVVSLWSTGLIEALNFGSLPISVCDPSVKSTLWNFIWPFTTRVLFWPWDQTRIESALQSENHYQHELMTLRICNKTHPTPFANTETFQ